MTYNGTCMRVTSEGESSDRNRMRSMSGGCRSISASTNSWWLESDYVHPVVIGAPHTAIHPTSKETI